MALRLRVSMACGVVGIPEGEGSSHALKRLLVLGVAGLPLGVSAGEFLFLVGAVAFTRLVFAPVGMACFELGVEPDTVCFLPVVMVGV